MKPIIFIDSGDTLVDETTERRDERCVVLCAELTEGARELLLTLRERGYTVALVADGLEESFRNIYARHGLSDCFAARAISELVGVEKPDARMFQTAMDALGLAEEDKSRIFMIGNNIKKDIRGANRFGITSVWMDWSTRYDRTPACEDDFPDIRIHKLPELLPYLDAWETES